MSVFDTYAKFYDQIYHDKDYAGEARYVADVVQRLVNRPTTEVRMIDLACGTARHVVELAKLGYRIDGSDMSPHMVTEARARAAAAGLDLRFHNETFQSCHRIDRKFDVALALFSAIDYLTDAADLERLLQNLEGLLAPGGIFLFDFWNGYAVSRDYSPVRVREVTQSGRRVIRTSRTTLDPLQQVAAVTMDFMVLEDGRLAHEFKETHRMRYWYPMELKAILRARGYEVLFECPFLEPDRPVGQWDWNLTFAVRKVRA